MSSVQQFKGPVVLIVLDGWGNSPNKVGNAIRLAKTPNFDALTKKYPSTELLTHGRYVGLVGSQKGNSEAGHLNLGAGRIVEQDVAVITREIKEGRFFKNPAFTEAIAHVQKYKSQMHLMGLLSGTQSAHVEMKHVYALLRLMSSEGISKVFLHLFTDGRDSSPHGAINYLRDLKKQFLNHEQIATICGRFYAMDRNRRWDRTAAAYLMLTKGQGIKVKSAEEVILQSYNRGETDEFIRPTVITNNGEPTAVIKENDSVIFFNLRSDRARQLTKAFVQKNFCDLNKGCFYRRTFIKNLKFVAMTDFGPDLDHILTAYPSKDVTNTLPMVLKDYQQLYLAETEKYAHVTFFFNGGYDHAVGGEERIAVPSPHVDSYDQKPEMSAFEVTKVLLKKLQSGKQFIAVNFANPDMIAHSGNFKAGILAVEACDQCLGKIVDEILRQKGVAIVTADHGNVEEMIDIETNEMDTEHSGNPVPFILAGEKYQKVKLRKGILADVAPTILEIFGVKKPREMTGDSLLID